MSVRELGHRLHETRVKIRWRSRYVGWPADVSDGDIHEVASFRERLAFATPEAGIAASAERTSQGRLSFFGRDWPAVSWAAASSSGFWRRDPVTGGDWPGTEARFLGIDLRRTGHDPAGPLPGDVKFVWEPARLQMLHPLAALAAGGDREAGRLAMTILRDFAEANPPHCGVHWCSGIELALRLVAVTLLVAALGKDGFDRQDRVMIRRFVAAHARQIAAFPSLYSSANNHRVAEGLGLFLAGILVPDLGHSWEREGRAILEGEALSQILPDGVGAEQSPSYQAFACEMIAFAALVGMLEGRPFAPAVTDRLAAAASFLSALMDRNGHVPAIGDDDESRVVAQPPDREPRYVASVVAAIAGLTGRVDLLPPARDQHLRDALFTVPAGTGPVPDGVCLYRDGGYTVAHQKAAGRHFDLVVDHGPLGYLALAAHGHADALALWLGIDGIPVLIDPGTALYNSGGPMRLAQRESQSHNTLCIAGESQSRASSAFSWSNRAVTTLEDWRQGEHGGWSVTASHDGYRRRFGARHRRTVAREGKAIVIDDSLDGALQPLRVEIRFLVDGDLELGVETDTVVIARSGDVLCRIAAPSGFTISILRGASEGAVRARRFGELAEAQRIVFTGPMHDAVATTRITICEPGPTPHRNPMACKLLVTDQPSTPNALGDA